jgi:hypothetical protein
VQPRGCRRRARSASRRRGGGRGIAEPGRSGCLPPRARIHLWRPVRGRCVDPRPGTLDDSGARSPLHTNQPIGRLITASVTGVLVVERHGCTAGVNRPAADVSGCRRCRAWQSVLQPRPLAPPLNGTLMLQRTASEASPRPLSPRRGGTGGSLSAAAVVSSVRTADCRASPRPLAPRRMMHFCCPGNDFAFR